MKNFDDTIGYRTRYMMYLLTAVGLGSSSKVHIYTNNTQNNTISTLQ